MQTRPPVLASRTVTCEPVRAKDGRQIGTRTAIDDVYAMPDEPPDAPAPAGSTAEDAAKLLDGMAEAAESPTLKAAYKLAARKVRETAQANPGGAPAPQGCTGLPPDLADRVESVRVKPGRHANYWITVERWDNCPGRPWVVHDCGVCLNRDGLWDADYLMHSRDDDLRREQNRFATFAEAWAAALACTPHAGSGGPPPRVAT